jgi:hypothetical protein
VLTLLNCSRLPNNTAIDMQVRSDVTRYRYGDEQHLEEALKRIFKYGQVLNQVIQHSASEVIVSYVSKLYVSDYS